jgi:hypothetical protein
MSTVAVKVISSKLAIKPEGQHGPIIHVPAGETIDLVVGKVSKPHDTPGLHGHGIKEVAINAVVDAAAGSMLEFINAPVMGSASAIFHPVPPADFDVTAGDERIICREYGMNAEGPTQFVDHVLEPGETMGFTTTEVNAVTVELLAAEAK